MRVLDIPEFTNDMVKISDYKDIAAVLRDPNVKTIFADSTGGRDPEFVRNALHTLDGAEHLERRQLESQLFSTTRLAEYERSTAAMLDRFFTECEAYRQGDG